MYQCPNLRQNILNSYKNLLNDIIAYKDAEIDDNHLRNLFNSSNQILVRNNIFFA